MSNGKFTREDAKNALFTCDNGAQEAREFVMSKAGVNRDAIVSVLRDRQKTQRITKHPTIRASCERAVLKGAMNALIDKGFPLTWKKRR